MKQAVHHTPGPWNLCKNAHGWFLKTKDGCILGGINRFPDTALLAAQCEPNAHLIAAAPDLLEALRVLLGDIERHPQPFTREEKLKIARAALAKAELAA